MKERGIRVYIGLMCAAAVVCLVFTRWSSLGTLPVSSKLALGGLTLIALLSESVAIRMSVGASAGGASSIMFIPMLAGVQLFGPPPVLHSRR